MGVRGKHAQKRRRIAMMAIMIGLVAALIEFPMPAEDALRAVRAELRSRPAPQDIVLIAIDDETLNVLHNSAPSRANDAMLVDRAFSAGIERLVFDRAFADPGSADENQAFAKSMREHRGQVWLGASPAAETDFQQHTDLLPTPALRPAADIASMKGFSAPFGLSVRFPTEADLGGQKIPSLSAVLAGYHGEPGVYRPDFALDWATVPTVGYSDVLDGKVGAAMLRGKTAIVAPTHLQASDFHDLPLGGKIPGGYFHVIGAHTLKSGLPLNLSWYPALLLAAAVVAYQASRKRPLAVVNHLAFGFLLFAPLVLEEYHVSIEIFPALITLAAGAIRLRLFASRFYSRSTSLPLPEAIVEDGTDQSVDIYALKINNLGDFPQAADPGRLGRLIGRLIDQMAGWENSGGAKPLVAFEKDTLLWKVPRLPRHELDEHGLGIVSLLRASRCIDETDARLEVTLGIDNNYLVPIEQRSQNALQAAELGSRRGALAVVADLNFLAERQRRIMILSQIESAIRDRTIDVMFQPKICLSSKRAVGAEALIRWTHQQLGYVDPMELVLTAEEHGWIDDLTIYVIEQAVTQSLAILRVQPRFRLAVNVSPRTLANRAFPDHLDRVLRDNNFPVGKLIIEVTESCPLEDSRVADSMAQLLKAGVVFSLDDFGTGHSSLDYLQRVPCSEIKIDRRFVKHLSSSQNSEALLRGTIDLAHRMGKTVVAEGVEDRFTEAQLVRMGCDLAQGYLYSKAVPIEQLLKTVRQDQVAA